MSTRFAYAGILMSVVVLCHGNNSAHADENRFAVVTLNNNTKDVTIHISYRWGDGEWKVLKNLKPGTSEWFSSPLDSNGSAPEFQMKINEAIGAAQESDKTYKLKWNAAPDKGTKFGHQHEVVRDKSNKDYVSVYDLGK